MNLKRVLSFAILLMLVASVAYADPGFEDGILNMPVNTATPPAATATLDLTNNSAYMQTIQTSTDGVTWTPVANNYATASQFIAQAYAGGNWTGLGITSTVAASHKNDCGTLSGLYALAPMTVTDYGAEQAGNPSFDYSHFDGASLTGFAGTTVLTKFTYEGDANLDGLVTYLDYAAIDHSTGSIKQGNTVTTTWGAGDFNMDGTVNYLDYGLIDKVTSYAKSHTLGALSGGGGITPVPEPSTLVLVFFALAALVSLRKIGK